MDTSKEYIKMCHKAEDIQKCFLKLNKKTEGRDTTYSPDLDQERFICLFRQDQLQEIILKPKYDWYDSMKGKFKSLYHALIWDFSNFAEGENLTSMEQLWLAFVMQEKFDKKWNGEDWI